MVLFLSVIPTKFNSLQWSFLHSLFFCVCVSSSITFHLHLYLSPFVCLNKLGPGQGRERLLEEKNNSVTVPLSFPLTHTQTQTESSTIVCLFALSHDGTVKQRVKLTTVLEVLSIAPVQKFVIHVYVSERSCESQYIHCVVVNPKSIM